MLRQRIVTALVIAPLAVWGVFALSASLFAAVVGAIMVVGAWEWSRLAGLTGRGARSGYTLAFAALLFLLYPLFDGTGEGLLVLGVPALIWWCAGLVWVIRFPLGSGLWRSRWAVGLAGLAVLLPAWAMVSGLRVVAGPHFVLLLLVLVWGADVGAFFAGRRWGRRKLAPQVSPGKTWEGFAGAMAVSGLVALASVGSLPVPAAQRTLFVILCLLTVAVSVLGDLMESMFKRLAGVKDSGSLLPGHGGVLDRIDSITAAAPVFAVGLLLIGVAA